MANGPPTPPPTTEAEIQDEARSAAETAVAISALPQSTRDDAYQAVFPAIADLASQSKFPELIELAEVTELNVCHGEIILQVHNHPSPESIERCRQRSSNDTLFE
ncbi:hypothetical protein H0H81_003333 [Sphagnurus paluster]|uniref:Uncharacterized protein n=1 Tax=Sphagnurus paluster TaxID=117069 RepID=A0A9P7K4D1_9AGAR|nr:hypothetical protein H0H81_003333 [Sphagnurus paluster]